MATKPQVTLQLPPEVYDKLSRLAMRRLQPVATVAALLVEKSLDALENDG